MSVSQGAQMVLFQATSVTFRSPGGNVQIELSLELELDPEGWGDSRFRLLLMVFSDTDVRHTFFRTFFASCDFRRPEGVHWIPKWFPTGSQKGNKGSVIGIWSRGVLGARSSMFLTDSWFISDLCLMCFGDALRYFCCELFFIRLTLNTMVCCCSTVNLL